MDTPFDTKSRGVPSVDSVVAVVKYMMTTETAVSQTRYWRPVPSTENTRVQYLYIGGSDFDSAFTLLVFVPVTQGLRQEACSWRGKQQERETGDEDYGEGQWQATWLSDGHTATAHHLKTHKQHAQY